MQYFNQIQHASYEIAKSKGWYIKNKERLGVGADAEVYEVYNLDNPPNIEGDAPLYAMKIYRKEKIITPKDIEKYERCSDICVKVIDWWVSKETKSSVIIFLKLNISLWNIFETKYESKDYAYIFCYTCKALLALKDLHIKYDIIHNDANIRNFMFDDKKRCFIIDLDRSTNAPKKSRVYLDKIMADYDKFMDDIYYFGRTHNFDYARNLKNLQGDIYFFLKGIKDNLSKNPLTIKEIKEKEDFIIKKITSEMFMPREYTFS